MNIVQVAQLIVKDSGVAGLFQGQHMLSIYLISTPYNTLYPHLFSVQHLMNTLYNAPYQPIISSYHLNPTSLPTLTTHPHYSPSLPTLIPP